MKGTYEVMECDISVNKKYLKICFIYDLDFQVGKENH